MFKCIHSAGAPVAKFPDNAKGKICQGPTRGLRCTLAGLGIKLGAKVKLKSRISFASKREHEAWLKANASLPEGFYAASTSFNFRPDETETESSMSLSLLLCSMPSTSFAGVLTQSAFPGAPVQIAKEHLKNDKIAAIIVNTKVANVCAPEGLERASRVCRELARSLSLNEDMIIPASTGVIGWGMPIFDIIGAQRSLLDARQDESILPVARGIMTTDLYPKIRRRDIADGTVVGIAKGAGMVEPNMATMLCFIVSDIDIPKEELDPIFKRCVDRSLNAISIDSDQSTSDMAIFLSSQRNRLSDLGAFEEALGAVCSELAEDIVRNGEGTHHVIKVRVKGAPDERIARGMGKAILNSPLCKCAIAGNDPNVGRILMAIGDYVGGLEPALDASAMELRMGGMPFFKRGRFFLEPELEELFYKHLKEAELYSSAEPKNGVFRPSLSWPVHEKCVELEISLGLGDANFCTIGSDLTHEYVSENADYRS